MSAPVTLRRYALPSINGEGWAVVVLGSDGYFSTVSDWGNYAYWWGSHGREDFREFVIGLAGSIDYAVGKLSPGRHTYDGPKTLASVKESICQLRRDGSLSREEARHEWDLLDRYDLEDSEGDLARWMDHTQLIEAWGYAVYSRDSNAVGYAKHVLPRLAEVLKAELEAERAAVPEVG
jgi:hypothetical protein